MRTTIQWLHDGINVSPFPLHEPPEKCRAELENHPALFAHFPSEFDHLDIHKNGANDSSGVLLKEMEVVTYG